MPGQLAAALLIKGLDLEAAAATAAAAAAAVM